MKVFRSDLYGERHPLSKRIFFYFGSYSKVTCNPVNAGLFYL